MNTRSITVCFALILVHLFLPQTCQSSSFFDMTLKQDSIYTPGKMKLIMKLTNQAKIEGQYQFRVSIYVTDTLIRKQALPVTKEKPAIFELTFPEAHSRTHVRCRSELFINGQFIEAKEKPLTLWPPPVPYPKELSDKVIWVFDTSGRLQKIFEDFEVEITDATFQAARSFETPDIVFIGQDLDPNGMRIITNHLASVGNKPVTVFLRQKQLPQSANIEIPKENNRSENIVCDMNSPLLQGLTKPDIMNMADKAVYAKAKKQNDKDWSVNSCVSEVVKEKKHIYSYLLSIEEKKQVTIYCQLPVTDGDDPRHGTLLNNLLRFAYEVSTSQNNRSNNNI